MTWYYAIGQEQKGPVTDEQLQALVKDGVVTGDTLIWREGQTNWQPHRVVLGGERLPSPPATGPAPQSQPTLPAQTEFAYAGFWLRFCAKLIDGLVVGVPIGIVLLIVMVGSGQFSSRGVTPGGIAAITLVQVVIQIAGMALSVLYNTLLVGYWGTTLGKKACGLAIVKADGTKVTYGRACGRAFAEIISGLVCYIGYIIAGFDDQKRALHDHMCDTRVVRVR